MGSIGTVQMTVQELAGALGTPDVPAQYIVRAHQDQQLAAAVVAPVPVIDLGRLLKHGDGTSNEAAKLRSAIESWGLFMVSNHGVDAVMDDMMAASREFFWQPLEEKRRYTNLISGERFQFEGYGNDRVSSPDQILDWTDRLYLKVEPEDERHVALWPAQPKTFRDALHEFTKKCGGVKDDLLRAMAKLLELNDDDYFVKHFGERPLTNARCSYYPECPRPELVFGLKPHSDGTVVTVLMVDDRIGGLQVLKDGVWWDVPIVPHTLLLIIGDQTEIMSNGILKSPVHRVVTNTKKERLSVALDYSVDPKKEIEPSAQLINEKRSALYTKVKIKDYFARNYNDFTQGKMAIDTVKV
ncbi:protein LATERAL BRANCHING OXIDOREDUCTASE 1-like [Aegilops tauschii subsp. strangulata]|nr:protein SRG1-like [Aegilops tauschii subsp. strangulata]XP_044445177.1 protein SRG1-like [Triticum aestivum]